MANKIRLGFVGANVRSVWAAQSHYPARILARGERTAMPPVLCLARRYEEGHPRPDLDEFVRQYRQAGGTIDVTIFEGEGEGLLRNLSSPTAQQALEQMITFIHQHLG